MCEKKSSIKRNPAQNGNIEAKARSQCMGGICVKFLTDLRRTFSLCVLTCSRLGGWQWLSVCGGVCGVWVCGCVLWCVCGCVGVVVCVCVRKSERESCKNIK